jgi:hypothetical protein
MGMSQRPKGAKGMSELETSSLGQLISEALAIEADEAGKAGALGFMARALVQATLPHSKVDGPVYTRTNGNYSLTLMAPPDTGLPYGSIPRLLLAWITTEAVRTRERELVLADSLSGFMRELDLVPTGGRWGSIGRLKAQMTSLFASSVTCIYDDGKGWALQSVKTVDEAHLWWQPKTPAQAALWKSTITLGERFFDEVVRNPVPVDMRALKALKRSPMALDIYVWLTYRLSYLKKPTTIPWEALERQFGAGYKHTRQFKAAFIRELRKVALIFQDVKVEDVGHGFLIHPGRPHIFKGRTI